MEFQRKYCVPLINAIVLVKLAVILEYAKISINRVQFKDIM